MSPKKVRQKRSDKRSLKGQIKKGHQKVRQGHQKVRRVTKGQKVRQGHQRSKGQTRSEKVRKRSCFRHQKFRQKCHKKGQFTKSSQKEVRQIEETKRGHQKKGHTKGQTKRSPKDQTKRSDKKDHQKRPDKKRSPKKVRRFV